MSAGHIYLIDDDSSVRESISRMLKSYGFSVESYADPEDYLKQAIPVSPAAIILDVRMPGMSGVELHAKLNEMGRKTPIIYISGESMPHEISSFSIVSVLRASGVILANAATIPIGPCRPAMWTLILKSWNALP